MRTSRAHYLANRERARDFVARRLSELNIPYGFTIRRVSIRNQSSRWGSCSVHGNLNFNYKIIFLPLHLADYIMIHELCHRGAMNHGPDFWELVARTQPHYKQLHSELRKTHIPCF